VVSIEWHVEQSLDKSILGAPEKPAVSAAWRSRSDRAYIARGSCAALA
jgi:hypothetical protein